ncbi:CocE/NonD family hydrolase, partial [Listeria seeligeri]|uniref:CocE/NonD family hydrolase n=1 Tax=Listeria seeligeri TaxID=1640 RepID=UPI00117FB927
LAEQGYIVIVQDVRGRYTSEGEFVPYIAEVDDGYDTIEWAANLPYANGDVGMFGLSYYGYTQILAAIEKAKQNTSQPTMIEVKTVIG